MILQTDIATDCDAFIWLAAQNDNSRGHTPHHRHNAGIKILLLRMAPSISEDQSMALPSLRPLASATQCCSWRGVSQHTSVTCAAYSQMFDVHLQCGLQAAVPRSRFF